MDRLMDLDPRDPERTILAIEKTSRDALVTMSCGHVLKLNVLFMYRVGDRGRCFECRDPKFRKEGCR